jgi:hypothetical protein
MDSVAVKLRCDVHRLETELHDSANTAAASVSAVAT